MSGGEGKVSRRCTEGRAVGECTESATVVPSEIKSWRSQTGSLRDPKGSFHERTKRMETVIKMGVARRGFLTRNQEVCVCCMIKSENNRVEEGF